MRTVSNTSPIYNLACIDRLPLLHDQFHEIWIPAAVAAELRQIPDARVAQPVDQALQTGWIRMQSATNDTLISLLMVDLHRGEAEAIALAVEMQADRLLIDEREGRARARPLGLAVTGVLGVLLRAKKAGRIAVLRPEIEALRSKGRFFIAPSLEATVLAIAGEQ